MDILICDLAARHEFLIAGNGMVFFTAVSDIQGLHIFLLIYTLNNYQNKLSRKLISIE